MAMIGFQAFVDATQLVLARGDAAQAVQRAQHVLHFYPEAIAAWYLLGEAQLAQEHTSEARESFRRVLYADPQHIGALTGLATSYECDGLIGQAIATLEQVVELAPDAAVIRQRLVALYQRLDAEPTQLLSRAALAYLYLRADMVPLAIGELRVLCVTQPERLDLRVALAEALWHTHQTDAVVDVCHAVLVRAPNVLKPNIILGHLLRSNNEPYGEALWRKTQALDPCMEVAHTLLNTWHDPSPLLPPLPHNDATSNKRIEADVAQVAPAPTLDDEIRAVLHWLDQIDQPQIGRSTVVGAANSALQTNGSVASGSGQYQDGAVVIASYVEQLRVEPQNNVLRLALARLGTRTGHYQLAFEQYEQLLAHNSLIEHLIDDLHELLGEHQVRHQIQRVQALLKEAYVFQGRYREAMNVTVDGA